MLERVDLAVINGQISSASCIDAAVVHTHRFAHFYGLLHQRTYASRGKHQHDMKSVCRTPFGILGESTSRGRQMRTTILHSPLHDTSQHQKMRVDFCSQLGVSYERATRSENPALSASAGEWTERCKVRQ